MAKVKIGNILNCIFNRGALSTIWSSTAAYIAGQYVAYGNYIYKCIKNATAGTLPTDTTYWVKTDLASEITSLNSNFATLNGSLANDTIYNGSGNLTIKTRISANQTLSLLAIVVSQYGDKDSTASEVLLLRTGFSGNHLSQVKIAQSGTFFELIPTLSVSSDGYIQIEGHGGNFSIKFISTGRLN